jgi:hypothetical protein
VPLLVIPGPLLAFSLWRWRDRDARLIFLASVVPQRWCCERIIQKSGSCSSLLSANDMKSA